ncbi:MAG TPA: class I SAM-dependent methyltransferase, partial [Ktedonobacterales bacterium]|nr:class I SAM-dependent methyltransferase [Ktedonobacterales bacterium]
AAKQAQIVKIRKGERTVVAENEAQSQYALAQSGDEMRRLALQAEVLHTQPTRWLFAQAGLSVGMRVLDVGCGAGDGSFLAAEFVGPSGRVVGIDSSPQAIETARLRASRAGLSTVAFEKADLQAYESPEPFDALVGRAVLMHLPTPAAALQRLLRSVRPGGVVAFREVLIGEPFLEATPRSELVDRFNAWYMTDALPALEALGLEGKMGFRLHQVFRDAGLPAPQLWLHAPVGSEPGWPGWEYIGQQVQMIAATAAKAGASLPSELEPASLGARIRDAVLQQGGVLRLQRGVQAWARKPESPSRG